MALSCQGNKKVGNRLPHILTAGKAAPLRTNEADESITLVDRHEIITVRRRGAIDEQRFDLIFHFRQHGIFIGYFVPGFEVEQGLDAARGTRVEGGRAEEARRYGRKKPD